MSVSVEQVPVVTHTTTELNNDLITKPTLTTTTTTQVPASELKYQHPLHQYDLTKMSKFYSACVGKLKETTPEYEPIQWAEKRPAMPVNDSDFMSFKSMVFSSKQKLYDAFATYARETGEPMIIMPNFDYGDILNFERFLQALKQDGVNAIGKYKLYLNNKDMRKFEVDMVVVHPRYGVLLFEVKDCDHLDSKRRSRAKAQLNNARSCFDSMGRLIAEAKGWTQSEAKLKVTDYIVLPNVVERPVYTPKHSAQQQLNQSLNQTGSSTSSYTRTPRQLSYLIKSDLSSKTEFATWFTKYVVEPKMEQERLMEEQKKVNKFDLPAMNYMLGLINTVRNNSVMPVVYPETEYTNMMMKPTEEQTVEEVLKKTTIEGEQTTMSEELEKEKLIEKMEKHFEPALNVYAEFFQKEHEAVRSLSKVFLVSSDSEKLRKALCLQTLYFLLNDSQKKISVITSELNKAYYEDFFARQRKLYNNLNNVRFYSNLSSCAVAEGQHTIKNNGETWFFDCSVEGKFEYAQIFERVKDLTNYWIFGTDKKYFETYKTEVELYSMKTSYLDFDLEKMKLEYNFEKHIDYFTMPYLTGESIKLPLNLTCDLLVIGDLVSLTQLKSLYRYLKSTHVVNYASQTNNRDREPKQQQLNFNPSKKFRSVKFIRGGSIDNLRNSLKMHDSIQANVVLMHVGDEDLLKSRSSQTTVDRIKELTSLVKEYCPKSFTVVSNLMKRNSRSDSTHSNEVNKGMSKFLKEAKEAKEYYNVVHMNNGHMEPEYHTQEGGRALNNKGLRMYVDNFLYTVDYYFIRNHKQN
jgi:hypothetical protein